MGLATFMVDVRVAQLEHRADDERSFAQALLITDRLRQPDFPARGESGYWVDLDNEPLLAYFGTRTENGVELFDGIPVCYICCHAPTHSLD